MWRKKLLGRLCWPPSVSAACQGFLPSSENMMASKLRHHTIAAVMKKKHIWKWKMDWLNCAEQFSRCWNAPSQVYRKACWNLIRWLYNYIDYIFGRRCSRHGCSGYCRLSCIVQPRPNTQAMIRMIGGMWRPLTAVFQSRIIVEFAIFISFMMFYDVLLLISGGWPPQLFPSFKGRKYGVTPEIDLSLAPRHRWVVRCVLINVWWCWCWSSAVAIATTPLFSPL